MGEPPPKAKPLKQNPKINNPKTSNTTAPVIKIPAKKPKVEYNFIENLLPKMSNKSPDDNLPIPLNPETHPAASDARPASASIVWASGAALLTTAKPKAVIRTNHIKTK